MSKLNKLKIIQIKNLYFLILIEYFAIQQFKFHAVGTLQQNNSSILRRKQRVFEKDEAFSGEK